MVAAGAVALTRNGRGETLECMSWNEKAAYLSNFWFILTEIEKSVGVKEEGMTKDELERYGRGNV